MFPIPIVFEEQERILKKTSTQVVMDWDEAMAIEMREMQDICRLADIDFDFVIDQSGSVGETEWRKTMNIIAKNWIETIQPNGAQTCGNHVAARKFSGDYRSQYPDEDKFHERWHDFTPPPESEYEKFPNYTEYMKSVFIKEPYKGGNTHTAWALQKVNEEDIPLTRDGQKFVMVFTDGQSNDPHWSSWPNLQQEADKLANNTDAVFSIGITDDINESELKVIASDDRFVAKIKRFDDMQYLINKFVLEQDGCATPERKPFRKCSMIFA